MVESVLYARECGLRGRKALTEGVDFVLVHREVIDVPLHDLHQLRRVAALGIESVGDFCRILRAFLELSGAVPMQSFEPGQRLLDASGHRRSFIQLDDLGIHVPDHLRNLARFNQRVLDSLLLVLEGFNLRGNVLGKCVQGLKLSAGVACFQIELDNLRPFAVTRRSFARCLSTVSRASCDSWRVVAVLSLSVVACSRSTSPANAVC